jgi:hypothetical protein
MITSVLSLAPITRKPYWIALLVLSVSRVALRQTLIPGTAAETALQELPELVQRFLLLAFVLIIFRRLRDLTSTARIGFAMVAAGVALTAYIDMRNINAALQFFMLCLGIWPSAPKPVYSYSAESA